MTGCRLWVASEPYTKVYGTRKQYRVAPCFDNSRQGMRPDTTYNKKELGHLLPRNKLLGTIQPPPPPSKIPLVSIKSLCGRNIYFGAEAGRDPRTCSLQSNRKHKGTIRTVYILYWDILQEDLKWPSSVLSGLYQVLLHN